MKSAADLGVNLRLATLNDLGVLSALWVQLMQEHEAKEPRFVMAEDAAVRWRNDFPAWIEDGTRRFLLAELAGQVVGFIQAHRYVEPPIYAEVPEVFVDEIYLLPEKRGLGIGRVLLDAIKQWAGELGAAQLRFRALTANEDGIRFWKSMGAEEFIITFTIPIESEGQREMKKQTRRLGF